MIVARLGVRKMRLKKFLASDYWIFGAAVSENINPMSSCPSIPTDFCPVVLSWDLGYILPSSFALLNEVLTVSR